jgi:Protein of unknown function (DUF4246)
MPLQKSPSGIARYLRRSGGLLETLANESVKVFDEEIISKWREEILESGEDVTPKMMDWIVKEMQWKADVFKKDGLLSVFDVGVVRSDSAVTSELQEALLEAVAPLEDVPADEKDYHPESDMKVVDLAHPSLFPVVYGRTHILPDRLITIDDCLESIGQGELLPSPSEEDAQVPRPRYGHFRWRHRQLPPYSRKFQWLPCDVEFTDEGGCRIISYINNVHPVKHRALYSVVERIIGSVIPLWDESLTERRTWRDERIRYKNVEFLDSAIPEPERKEEEDDDDEYFERYDEWERSRPIKLPEPGEFSPPKEPWRGEVRLRDQFRDNGLQVIVKLANIELNPEKPEYEGGSWHIEGQLVSYAFVLQSKDNESMEVLTAFRMRGFVQRRYTTTIVTISPKVNLPSASGLHQSMI